MVDSEELATALGNRSISDLCGLLQGRGLTTEGRKPALIERLKQDVLSKGDGEELLKSFNKDACDLGKSGAPFKDVGDWTKRKLDATERYIAEHLKDNKANPENAQAAKARTLPDSKQAAKVQAQIEKCKPTAETLRASANQSAKANAQRSRSPAARNDSARARGGRAGRERSRERSPPPAAKEPDDPQAQALRKLSADLGRSGLRETLKSLDEAVAKGDIAPSIMADLETKLSTAIDLIEAQRDSEAASV